MATTCTPVNNDTLPKDVTDEEFEKVYSLNDGAVEVVNDRRTFQTVIRGSFNCATGKNSYSSGVHRIRMKVHSGHAFVGIRSRNIIPVPDVVGTSLMYIKTPSTYGWFTNGGRLVNGWPNGHKLNGDYREDSIFTLIINCDQHRLTIIINENHTEQDEMEVDHLHAPFPWCLFVQLNRVGAKVSLL